MRPKTGPTSPNFSKPRFNPLHNGGGNKPGKSGPAKPTFSVGSPSGKPMPLTKGKTAQGLDLAKQYEMSQKGDVARRLGLYKQGPKSAKSAVVANPNHGTNVATAAATAPISHAIGWHVPHHPHGWISPAYAHGCFWFHHAGPFYYPHHCWYPKWAPWVSWCWHWHVHPKWDPRPLWCRPLVCVVAPRWFWWRVPIWAPLPVVACGTWVDVPLVEVGPEHDLQLLAVRFVEPGHPQEQLGPRYRVWFRNNSSRPIQEPFDVFLLASNDGTLSSDLPQAGVRVTRIEAGQVQAVDVRLPLEVCSMGVDETGQPAPFGMLHVLVDANREVAETSETNNGAKLAREDVLPVDPAAFAVEPGAAAAGGEVVLAGEGFGPEPGQVLLHLGGIEMEAEILGWCDLGVRLALPKLPLAGAAEANLIVVRGDGAAANALQITVTPPSQDAEATLVTSGAGE